MYMHGLSDITDGTDSTDSSPVAFTPVDAPNVYIEPPPVLTDSSGNYYSSSPEPMPSASGSGTSWTNLFGDALKAWGTVAVANKQAQSAQSAQQYAYASQLAARGMSPNGLRLPGQTYPVGYSPFPAARPATSPISPVVILAAIGLGAAALFLA